MLTAKEAVAKAATYMVDMYGNPEGLLVEEVELDSQQSVWVITMGFWLALPLHSTVNPLNPFMSDKARVRRVYKQLRIGTTNGEVVSMKIRQLKDPE